MNFLEKRINEIFEIYGGEESKDENDPLFATKKWMCASCAKDLGKFEGKLSDPPPSLELSFARLRGRISRFFT